MKEETKQEKALLAFARWCEGAAPRWLDYMQRYDLIFLAMEEAKRAGLCERLPEPYDVEEWSDAPARLLWTWKAPKILYTFFCWRLTRESDAAGVSISKGQTGRVNWPRFAAFFEDPIRPDRGAPKKQVWEASENWPRGAASVDKAVKRAIKKLKSKSKNQ